MHLKNSNSSVRTVLKRSHNISTNEIEVFVFDSNFHEQFTSDYSGQESTYNSEDTANSASYRSF